MQWKERVNINIRIRVSFSIHPTVHPSRTGVASQTNFGSHIIRVKLNRIKKKLISWFLITVNQSTIIYFQLLINTISLKKIFQTPFTVSFLCKKIIGIIFTAKLLGPPTASTQLA